MASEEPKKVDTFVTREENVSENVSVEAQENPDLDAAAKFLAENKDVDTTHINIDKLRHKVDRNVITVLCLLFILAFLDKAIYNVSLT
jgi:hypothetical protein